jgi:hypothetical protein
MELVMGIPEAKKMDRDHLINLLDAKIGGDGGTKPQGTSELSRIIGVDQMTIWNYIQCLLNEFFVASNY